MRLHFEIRVLRRLRFVLDVLFQIGHLLLCFSIPRPFRFTHLKNSTKTLTLLGLEKDAVGK